MLRPCRITVGGYDDVGTQVRHVGEGVADKYAGGEALLGSFNFPTHFYGLPKATGCGNQLITPHQHGQLDAGYGGTRVCF